MSGSLSVRDTVIPKPKSRTNQPSQVRVWLESWGRLYREVGWEVNHDTTC